MIRVARIWIAIYAATIALALYLRLDPAADAGRPAAPLWRWHMVMAGLLQHGGLADNVTDHRLNSRTVYMNPISRFIYWNMNYHVEHHMFPMVPYHALPRLHETDQARPAGAELRRSSPAIREMIPAFLRQLRYEDYFVKRELPPTARPYREIFPASPPSGQRQPASFGLACGQTSCSASPAVTT